MVNELEIDATLENLKSVNEFIKKILNENKCSKRDEMSLKMAIEEIYINIVNYAYTPNIGKVKINSEVKNDKFSIVLNFIDEGKPFNPLEQDEPDFDLDVEGRDAGGFGIFIVKDKVDDISYEYKDGKNILTIKKNLTKKK
jgi:anti-sigma regulatory factor (Ser/Thr protein kinase)